MHSVAEYLDRAPTFMRWPPRGTVPSLKVRYIELLGSYKGLAPSVRGQPMLAPEVVGLR
jgi:hypothetical protein